MAQKFHGKCRLRLDDTNPGRESSEYVEAIKRDVEWLGSNKKRKEQDKTEKISKEKNEKTAEKKPSVLKALKENQQKIRQEEQGKGEKVAKKDKGMEL